MGIKGALAWGGGILGGLAVMGIAGFYLMPRACGCGPVADPTAFVGKSGTEISDSTQWCASPPIELPREKLTWWTVVGDRTLTSTATGVPLNDSYAFAVVPFGQEDSAPQTIDVLVNLDLFGLPVPEGTGTLSLAVTDAGAVPLGIVTTEWGAAYFVDGCAEAGLRDPALSAPLTDAQVAAWPTMTAAQLEGMYGPAPEPPEAITLASLSAVASADEDDVPFAITVWGQGSMPGSDAISVVTAEGVVNARPITALGPDAPAEMTTTATPGAVVGVVLERGGEHYLLGTLTMPQVVDANYLESYFTVNYERTQSVVPLEGGAAGLVPSVVMQPPLTS